MFASFDPEPLGTASLAQVETAECYFHQTTHLTGPGPQGRPSQWGDGGREGPAQVRQETQLRGYLDLRPPRQRSEGGLPTIQVKFSLLSPPGYYQHIFYLALCGWQMR